MSKITACNLIFILGFHGSTRMQDTVNDVVTTRIGLRTCRLNGMEPKTLLLYVLSHIQN